MPKEAIEHMKIAILGFGTVGSGVYEVLKTNYETITKRAGVEIDIKYVLDLRTFPGQPVEEVLVHDFDQIVNDPEVEIIVETMGGLEKAYSYVKEALLKGKSVCTSNKELVAKYGAELLEIAKQKKINFLFEASVGGGIPIIRPLNQSLTADQIIEITGVLNGTTNYMLTEMKERGISFQEALKEAQEKGFAERNPAADIEGYDACRKIAILTSLAYGKQVDYEKITTEGIVNISDIDIQYALNMKAAIKLLGSSKQVGDNIYTMVAPKIISENHPLYTVNGVFNGILVRGNVLGDVMFYGSGAGKLPTASAVVSDIVDSAKHKGRNIMTIWSQKELELADTKSLICKFFVRVKQEETEAARRVFPIKQVCEAPNVSGEFAFLTEQMSEETFKKAALKVSVLNWIRTEL